jgi:hypothetical protein
VCPAAAAAAPASHVDPVLGVPVVPVPVCHAAAASHKKRRGAWGWELRRELMWVSRKFRAYFFRIILVLINFLFNNNSNLNKFSF